MRLYYVSVIHIKYKHYIKLNFLGYYIQFKKKSKSKIDKSIRKFYSLKKSLLEWIRIYRLEYKGIDLYI